MIYEKTSISHQSRSTIHQTVAFHTPPSARLLGAGDSPGAYSCVYSTHTRHVGLTKYSTPNRSNSHQRHPVPVCAAPRC